MNDIVPYRMPQKFQRPVFHADLEDSFVVLVVSNTCRYYRRYELFEKIKYQLHDAGVDFVIVEVALGDRPFEVTHHCEPFSLQLRTVEELWHKENAQNLGVQFGRNLWKHKRKKRAMLIDADCEPVGRTFKQWLEETWHELQHYEFVQMWEWLQPLDYHGNPLGTPNPSFMSNYIKFGTAYPAPVKGYPMQWGSPGLAWAVNLSALDAYGGFGDVGILGAGDWYFAHSVITDLPFKEMTGYSPDYVNYWKHKQALAEKWIKRDVGFVRGLYTHHFHGKIKSRGYDTRENILKSGQFSPLTDIKKDHQGLWQLETWEPRQIWIRDKVRQYFRHRHEDSIDS